MKIGLNYSYTKKGPGRRHRAPEWLRDARRELRSLWCIRESKTRVERRIEYRKGHFVTIANHDLHFESRPGGH